MARPGSSTTGWDAAQYEESRLRLTQMTATRRGRSHSYQSSPARSTRSPTPSRSSSYRPGRSRRDTSGSPSAGRVSRSRMPGGLEGTETQGPARRISSPIRGAREPGPVRPGRGRRENSVHRPAVLTRYDLAQAEPRVPPEMLGTNAHSVLDPSGSGQGLHKRPVASDGPPTMGTTAAGHLSVVLHRDGRRPPGEFQPASSRGPTRDNLDTAHAPRCQGPDAPGHGQPHAHGGPSPALPTATQRPADWRHLHHVVGFSPALRLPAAAAGLAWSFFGCLVRQVLRVIVQSWLTLGLLAALAALALAAAQVMGVWPVLVFAQRILAALVLHTSSGLRDLALGVPDTSACFYPNLVGSARRPGRETVLDNVTDTGGCGWDDMDLLRRRVLDHVSLRAQLWTGVVDEAARATTAHQGDHGLGPQRSSSTVPDRSPGAGPDEGGTRPGQQAPISPIAPEAASRLRAEYGILQESAGLVLRQLGVQTQHLDLAFAFLRPTCRVSCFLPTLALGELYSCLRHVTLVEYPGRVSMFRSSLKAGRAITREDRVSPSQVLGRPWHITADMLRRLHGVHDNLANDGRLQELDRRLLAMVQDLSSPRVLRAMDHTIDQAADQERLLWSRRSTPGGKKQPSKFERQARRNLAALKLTRAYAANVDSTAGRLLGAWDRRDRGAGRDGDRQRPECPPASGDADHGSSPPWVGKVMRLRGLVEGHTASHVPPWALRGVDLFEALHELDANIQEAQLWLRDVLSTASLL